MTEISWQENNSVCKKDIKLWFDKMDLPYSIYNKLKPYHKELLHRSICKPLKVVSPEQRRELYNAFCSTIEFRSSNYKLGYEAMDNYLRDFFAPLTEHDRMPKDDWGGE